MSGAVTDLGSGHTLRFTAWAPDRHIPANAERYAGIPDVDKWGAIVAHTVPGADGDPCEGAITFDGPVQRQLDPQRPKWTVENWEPLTLSPSLLCHCGDHGFIRDGMWVSA